MASETLYTPEVLGLATGLAAFPWDEALPFQGEARSRSCGSSIRLGLSLGDDGRVDTVGMRSQACAVGQAAASLFAQGAAGRTLAEIVDTGNAVEAWLEGRCDLPDWPGMKAIERARDYPGRHGAIMLAWRAVRDILPTG